MEKHIDKFSVALIIILLWTAYSVYSYDDRATKPFVYYNPYGFNLLYFENLSNITHDEKMDFSVFIENHWEHDADYIMDYFIKKTETNENVFSNKSSFSIEKNGKWMFNMTLTSSFSEEYIMIFKIKSENTKPEHRSDNSIHFWLHGTNKTIGENINRIEINAITKSRFKEMYEIV